MYSSARIVLIYRDKADVWVPSIVSGFASFGFPPFQPISQPNAIAPFHHFDALRHRALFPILRDRNTPLCLVWLFHFSESPRKSSSTFNSCRPKRFVEIMYVAILIWNVIRPFWNGIRSFSLLTAFPSAKQVRDVEELEFCQSFCPRCRQFPKCFVRKPAKPVS